MLLDLARLDCSGCPAKHLFDFSHMQRVETMREEALNRMPERSARLILLCESTPARRFIYDLSSESKLRANLRHELVVDGTDSDLLRYMERNRIWLVDCALCPLHRLARNTDRREAATLCLQRNTIVYINKMPTATLIGIFPHHCGFKKTALRGIEARVTKRFDFSSLLGLNDAVSEAVAQHT